MKIQELRQLTAKKLQDRLSVLERELSVLRFHIKTGQSQKTSDVGLRRVEIAQINTILHNEKK